MLADTHLNRPSGALENSAMRILLIEDDHEASSFIVKAFRELGHVADSAENGLDGYALASEEHYDVLIVDRMLPKLDGLSLIRSLREQGVTTPVLILSALGQVDDRVKGLRAGGDDYLPKPYAFSELLARTEVLARRRGAAGTAEETRYRWATWNSIACPTGSAGAAGKFRCSRASFACSNTSCAMPDR